MHKKLYHIIITHFFADFHIFFMKKAKKRGSSKRTHKSNDKIMCRTKERRQLNKQTIRKSNSIRILCLIKLYSRLWKMSIVLWYFPQILQNLTRLLNKLPTNTADFFCKRFHKYRFCYFLGKGRKTALLWGKMWIFSAKRLDKTF